MSDTPYEDATEDCCKEDEFVVPKGLLYGIDDIDEGNTASKEDLESLLKY